MYTLLGDRESAEPSDLGMSPTYWAVSADNVATWECDELAALVWGFLGDGGEEVDCWCGKKRGQRSNSFGVEVLAAG